MVGTRALDLGIELPQHMGVTDNARLLLGYAAGTLIKDDGPYEIVSWDAAAGTQVIENSATGNTFLMVVVQLEGHE